MEASKRGDDSTSSRGGNDSSSKSKNSKRKTLRVASFPQSLPPEVAAQYLSQATAAAAMAWEKNSAKDGSSSSSSSSKPFGPSRPPSSSSSVSFGSLDLAALAQSGSLDFATAAAAASRSSSSDGNGGPPCSEAEMKALMSMFVEIMGMSMDPENSSSSNSKPSGSGRSKSVTQAAKSFLAGTSSSSNGSSSFPVFMFGNSSSSSSSRDIPPPPGGWPSSAAAAAVAAAAGLYRPPDGDSWGVDYYDDTDDEDDSIPDLDEASNVGRKQESTRSPSKSPSNASNSKMDSDFSPSVLAALEQVEMDDALQEEERARKAAKKREKKQRKKEKQKREAALKASQAAQKKREKFVLSWRSRVVSACQSNEVSKLESLLSESPLRPPKTHEESEEESQAFIKTHMDYLLPNCIAKNRQLVEKGREARQVLANFIMNWSVKLIFMCGRNGRAALHTACFTGDVYFVQLALERAAAARENDASALFEAYRNIQCEDSGWSPGHYAVLSGSNYVIEALLSEGECDLQQRTDESKTWRISNGQGITPRELAEIVRSGKQDKILETHGDAMKDMAETHLGSSNERSRFQRVLEKIVDRLTDVERNGYCPPKDSVPNLKSDSAKEEPEAKLPSRSASSEDVSKKKKKKKKKDKQQNQSENEPVKSAPAPVVPEKKEDPMIAALLGMGFTSEQISEAAKACGGVERATADDLVQWIFAQESGEAEAPASNTGNDTPIENETTENDEEVPFTDPAAVEKEKKKKAQEQREQAAEAARQNMLEAAKREEEARVAAQRLAAKKEEQRRRNREWNNREQARQREEAQAKLAQEMERRARVEAQRVAMGRMAAAQQQQPQPPQLATGTTAPAMGVPQQVSYAPVAGPAAVPLGREQRPSSVQPSPPQMGAPTHFLQSNGKIRPVGNFVPGAPLPVSQQLTPQVQNHHASYPMARAPMNGMGMEVMPMANSGPPGYPGAYGQHQPSPLPAMNGEILVPGNEVMADPRQSMVPPEDATVSSAGSGRPPRDIRVTSTSGTPQGPTGMTASSNTPPPGFRPPASTPTPSTTEQHSEEPNQLGEIRATAKAFVPSNFKPAPQQMSRVATAPAGMPSPTPSTEFFPASSRVTRAASDLAIGGGFSGEQGGTDTLTLLDPVNSLLGGTFSSTSTSLAPGASTRLSGTLDPSPVPSAASSVTGGAPGGSSLLDSVPIGTSSSVGDIWGSSGGASSTAPAIGGLPSFGFGDATSSVGSAQAVRSFGTLDNVFGDTNKETNSNNWGSAERSGNSNGLGSIW